MDKFSRLLKLVCCDSADVYILYMLTKSEWKRLTSDPNEHCTFTRRVLDHGEFLGDEYSVDSVGRKTRTSYFLIPEEVARAVRVLMDTSE